jgi:hypothetical protein
MRGLAIAVAIASSVPTSGDVSDDRVASAMRVYVTAAQVEARTGARDTSQALKWKRDRARSVRRVLENDLRARYGKSRESWPPERDRALFRLEDAEALAEADFQYRKFDLRDLVESAREIEEAFRDDSEGQRVTLVDSASDADLVVEVAACRTAKSFPTQNRPDRCYILFTVGAGARIDAARFSKVPVDYRSKKFGTRAWRIAGPNPEKPVFYFESYNGGGNEFGCQTAAAGAASAAVDKFIEDNHSVLLPK